MSSISQILLFVITGGIICISGIAVYRLWLHPVAKYPGPLFGRLTDWYSVLHCAEGDRHVDLLELHRKYGDIVRFGPNRISINTNEGLKNIYGKKANTRKSTSYYSVFAYVFKGDSSLTTIDPIVHGQKRRVVSQALSENACRELEPIVLENIRLFCASLGEDAEREAGIPDNMEESLKSWSSPKNITLWTDYLTFDVMASVCFSSSFEMLSKEDNRYILDTLPIAVNALNMVGHMSSLIKLGLGGLVFGSENVEMERYKEFSKKQSDKRIARGTDVKFKDVFSFLLEAKDDETGYSFSMEELVGESSLLITGGSDSTATSICTTIFYLLHNPHTLERLKQEVRSKFAVVEDVRIGRGLSSCKYLRACIDEAMRMSPAVPGVLPREVLHGGLTVNGNYFPPGTDVGTSSYVIHHNEKYFPDSFAYNPQRWLVDEKTGVSEDDVELALSAFCPFSTGPRGCVGKSFAIKEIMITIARLIVLYEMRLTSKTMSGEKKIPERYGRPNEYRMRDWFVGKGDGPFVEFQAR